MNGGEVAIQLDDGESGHALTREELENRAAVAVLPGSLADVEPLAPSDLGEAEVQPLVDGQAEIGAATTKPIVTRVLAAVCTASAPRPALAR